MPRVRAGRRADLDALYDLDLRTFGRDSSSRRSIERSLRSEYQEVRVAEANGILIGATITFFRKLVARHYSLAVTHEWQGRGVGRLLIRSAEGFARLRGCVVARLEVRADNARAISFYRSHGYRETEIRVGYYADGMNALRMERVL